VHAEPDASEGSAAPELVLSLAAVDDDAADDDPYLSRNGLQLFFNSDREGGPGRGDIWVSERDAIGNAFRTPQLVDELSSEARETSIVLSSDALLAFVSSDREGGFGGLDVWVFERSTVSEPFGSATHVADLSTPGDDLVSGYEETLGVVALSIRENEDADYDLYLAEPDLDGSMDPRPVTELNTDGEDVDPHLVEGGKLLYFNSDRNSDAGGDLFVAEREGTGAPFGEPRPLEELNSEADERDPFLAGCELFFASDREGALRIYRSWTCDAPL
jgi:Tol biopolymer transport system component